MADTALSAPPRSPLSREAGRLAAVTRTSQGAVRLAELPSWPSSTSAST